MPASESKRLFFALWPEAGLAGRLEGVARAAQAVCGGRLVPRENLHLTLVFLGQVAVHRLEAVRAVAAAVSGEAFTLDIDRLGEWRRQGLVWAGCAAPPPPLTALVLALQAGLRGLGLKLEARAYAAHVTLLRKTSQAGFDELPRLQALSWPVSDFALVESQLAANGAAYRVIARWPLPGGRRPGPG